MTSEKIQRELVLKEYIISGIAGLYEDEELCSKIRFCDLYRHPQTTTFQKNTVTTDNDYSEKFTEYLYDFLFKDKPVSDVLQKMEDLTKVYTFSLNTKDSYVGLLMFILYMVTVILILSSLFLLHTEKYKKFYLLFLPEFNWFVIIVGILIILSAGFTKFGTPTMFKCHLYIFMLSVGFTLIYVPLLYKLIITFPDDNNKYTQWINTNKNLFFLIFILMDFLLNALTLIKPYKVRNIIINEGKNYQICSSRNNTSLKIGIYSIIIYKILFIILMFLLIFIEWNLKKIKLNLKFVVSSIYINIITFSLLFILIQLSIMDYLMYYLIEEIVIFIIALSNFIVLYLVRILIPAFTTKKDIVDDLIGKFDESITTNANNIKHSSEKNKSIISKILNYHKQEYTLSDQSQGNIKSTQYVSSENQK